MVIIKRLLKHIDELKLPVKLVAFSFAFLSGLTLSLALAIESQYQFGYACLAIIIGSESFSLSGLWASPVKVPFSRSLNKIGQHPNPIIDRFLVSLGVKIITMGAFFINSVVQANLLQ
jgi:hypothetical protein